MTRHQGAGHIVILGGVKAANAGQSGCDYALSVSECTRPHIGVLTTPSGDDPALDERFRSLFSRPCTIEPFTVFRDRPSDFSGLHDCDVVFVTGGNTIAALAVWRAYNLDGLLREIWLSGGVLAGWSAGSMCWFESGLTGSLAAGHQLPFDNGIGLLPGSHCPHFDDPERRERFVRCVADGSLPDGLGVDEGGAAHFVGIEMVEAISTTPGHSVHFVTRHGHDARVETVPAQAWR